MKNLIIRISQIVLQPVIIGLFALKCFRVVPKEDEKISAFENMFTSNGNLGIQITLWIFAATILALFVLYLLYFVKRSLYDKSRMVINGAIIVELIIVALTATLWGTYLTIPGIIVLSIATLSAFIQYIGYNIKPKEVNKGETKAEV